MKAFGWGGGVAQGFVAVLVDLGVINLYIMAG